VQKLKELDLLADKTENIHVIDLVDYIDMLCLQKHALFVMTDSGGIQEETSVLSVPYLTLRKNTGHPIPVSEGTSTLAGNSRVGTQHAAQDIIEGRNKKGRQIALWDGKTAHRVVSEIKEYFGVPRKPSCDHERVIHDER
jgi:UDP-N-acetylglucosamine 2-epimerase (non-hydrolysing)